MPYTLAQIRADLKAVVGDVWEGVATSDGGAGGTSLISTDLSARALTDDAYKYQWVLITSGTGVAGDERMVESFTRSSHTLVPAQAFSAPVPSGAAFEISKLRPSLLKRFINQALKNAYPRLHARYDHMGTIAGGLVYNDDFEDWSSPSSPEWWKVYATVTRDGTNQYHGLYCAKIVGTTASPSLSFAPLLGDANYQSRFLLLAGKSVTWQKKIKASNANSSRISITTVDGNGSSSTTYSSYHSGGGAYEMLSVTATVPDTLSAISFDIHVGNGHTAYADSGYCASPATLYEYPLSQKIDYVSQAFLGNMWDEPDYTAHEKLMVARIINREGRRWLRFDGGVDGGYKIRVKGYGPIEEVVNDTDTVDLTPGQEQAVVEMAAYHYFMYLAGMGTTTAKDRADYITLARVHEQEAETKLARNQMSLPHSTPFSTDTGVV